MGLIHVLKWALVGVLAASAAMSARATTVTYDLNFVSGTTWQYEFSVSNNTLSGDIEELTIYFDLSAFTNLLAVAAPADWDPIVVQPDTNLPQDGFFDWAALAGGVVPGQSLGLFRVKVDFSGGGAPAGPRFEVVDPDNFSALLDFGVAVSSANPVPEPGTWALLAAAGLAFSLRGRPSRGTLLKRARFG